MSTVFTVTVFSNDKKKAEKVISECFKIANNLEKKVNRRDEDGLIYKLNQKKELIINDDFVYKIITTGN